jgi:hypothetical protein
VESLPAPTTRDLLRQYSAILDELLARGVIRSRNAPAGDLAETLVAAAYDGELGPASQRSWDVRTADGRLLQVKCRVIERDCPRGNYSPFRSWGFDACVFLLLDSRTYDVVAAVEVPTDSIRSVAKDTPWVSGSRIVVRAPLLTYPGSIDVSGRLKDTFDALP